MTALFCLPHAGGTQAAFRGWKDALAPVLDVVTVQAPPRDSLLESADELADEVATHTPYAFFGHSLGGIVAFETVHALLRKGYPPPVRLFVCGCQTPPLEAAAGRGLHGLSDEKFLMRVGELGGLPPEVRDDPELREVLVPLLRSDYQLAETYEHQPGPPLPCPISVLCGRSDPLVDTGRLYEWNEHTGAGASVSLVEGDHFLLQDSAACLHDEIRAALDSPVHEHNEE